MERSKFQRGAGWAGRRRAVGLAVWLALCAGVASAEEAPPEDAIDPAQIYVPVSGTNWTLITSQILNYDMDGRHTLFEGKVRVVDSNLTVYADRLAIDFSESNTVRRLVATGRVRLLQADGGVALCRTATCDVVTGIVVLEGKAQMRRGAEVVRGDVIRMYQRPRRVIAEPGYLRLGGESRLGGFQMFDPRGDSRRLP